MAVTGLKGITQRWDAREKSANTTLCPFRPPRKYEFLFPACNVRVVGWDEKGRGESLVSGERVLG